MKMAGTQELTSRVRFNANKPLEYDPAAAMAPAPGPHRISGDPIVGASTVPR